MGVSGACCLLVGLTLGAPFWVVAVLTWVWGFFVVADSAQFSAMVTEVAPADSVGLEVGLRLPGVGTCDGHLEHPPPHDGAGWSVTR